MQCMQALAVVVLDARRRAFSPTQTQASGSTSQARRASGWLRRKRKEMPPRRTTGPMLTTVPRKTVGKTPTTRRRARLAAVTLLAEMPAMLEVTGATGATGATTRKRVIRRMSTSKKTIRRKRKKKKRKRKKTKRTRARQKPRIHGPSPLLPAPRRRTRRRRGRMLLLPTLQLRRTKRRPRTLRCLPQNRHQKQLALPDRSSRERPPPLAFSLASSPRSQPLALGAPAGLPLAFGASLPGRLRMARSGTMRGSTMTV